MHIVITGASSGIGAALARQFATLPDVRLTLVARRGALLSALAESLDAPTCCITRDLSDPALSSDWLDEAIEQHGAVDVLVNNAGVQVIGATAKVDVEAGESSVQLNLLAPLRLTRAVLPGMIASGTGCIINISSMAALAPSPAMTYYNASKAGLAAASEALAGELRTTGVVVLTVYPGIIDETAMAQKALAKYESSRMLALQPRGTAAALAQRVARALRRGKSGRVIYPRVNALARWFPGSTRWLIDHFAPGLRAAPAR